MENWISMINSDFSGGGKFTRKMDEAEIHNTYESEDNDVIFRRNSGLQGITDRPFLSGENTLYASSKACVRRKQKQPNTEMREKFLTKISKTLQQSMVCKPDENFNIDELPCSGEGGKWAMIRMYQERARRREARRRRQREKERGKSTKRKSRKRSKSRKRRKSAKRSKSRKRSKSKGRKKSGKRRRSRSKSRRRSRSKSRRRSRSKSRRRSRSKSRRRSRSKSRRRSRSKSSKKRSRSRSRKKPAKRTTRRMRRKST